MKRLYLACLICFVLFIDGCSNNAIFFVASHSDDKVITTSGNPTQSDIPFHLSAFFQDGNIVITESDDDTIINEILVPFDEYQVFLSMTDENNGYLLYCSSPAMGQMMKSLYVTEDRWATYDEKDISSLIDGYPTSLRALSSEHIYIGTQMRSNGYLFETTDGGKHWNSVSVDEGYYQYGYIPQLDKDSNNIYVLLGYELSGKAGNFSLYRSDTSQVGWEKVCSFTLEDSGYSMQECFIKEGSLFINDSQGNQYQINI